MLADVCDLNHIRIEAGSFSSLSEGCLVHTGRAGANNDTGKVLFCNSLSYKSLTCLGAHILIILSVNYAGFVSNDFYNFFNVYRCCNVTAAMANEYANSLHLSLPPVSSECAYEKLLGKLGIKLFGDLIC